MDIQFTGKINAALPVQQCVSKRDGKQWVKQEFCIEELNQRYPSRCCFQVFGSDKLQQMNIRQEEILTVHLGINAKQSQDGRWFNQLDCWKVERFGMQQEQTYQSAIGKPTQPDMMQAQGGNIPFPGMN